MFSLLAFGTSGPVEHHKNLAGSGGGISNLCISKSDLLKFIPAQRDLGVDRCGLRFEMRKFESELRLL